MSEPMLKLGLVLALCASLVLVTPREVLARDNHRVLVQPVVTSTVVLSTVGWRLPLIGWVFVGALQVAVIIGFIWLWATDQFRVTGTGEVDDSIPYEPDENYREVPRVTVPPPPEIDSDPRIDPASVADANALLYEMTVLVAQLRAFATGLARLYTAMARGEPEYAEVQRVYVRDLLLPEIEETTRRADGAVGRLAAAYQDVIVTRQDIQDYLAAQRRDGFPAGEEPFLERLGTTHCERMHGEMALLDGQFDREEYSVVDDAFPALRDYLARLPPFLRQYELAPALDLLRPVNGCAIFRRGDSDDDGSVALGDAISLSNFLFLGAAPPYCLEGSDTNDDGALDISDPIHLLGWLFLGMGSPPAPGPFACAWDPAGSPGYLGCDSERSCK